MRFFARPTFALAFGVFVFCGETCLHIEPLTSEPRELSSWPIHVWLAALFLIYGAIRARRKLPTGRPWLVAGWAFNASLLLGALFDLLVEHPAGTPPPQDEWIPLPVFTTLIGILLMLSMCGVLGTLAARDERTS